jgi:hypothetical protein
LVFLDLDRRRLYPLFPVKPTLPVQKGNREPLTLTSQRPAGCSKYAPIIDPAFQIF